MYSFDHKELHITCEIVSESQDDGLMDGSGTILEVSSQYLITLAIALELDIFFFKSLRK